MRISDWSSDVCSSDLQFGFHQFDVGTILHGRGFCAFHEHQCPLERGRASARANTLSASTVRVISSAAVHASCCQSSYGDSANWKITTGRLAIGAFMSVLQN